MNTYMSAPAPVATPARLRDVLRDNGLATAAMLLVVGVAAAGWSASFISLHAFARDHMGLADSAAWLVPSTFDGAALGLSLLAFRAAIYGRASIGSLLYVDGFTSLSSWINWIHIADHQGRFVAALLPIAAVVVFGKVLKEAREAYERRHGKQVFKVRGGLLVLRWLVDRAGTRRSIREQILAIPVEALIGLGAGTLAKQATEQLSTPAPAAQTPALPAPEPETATGATEQVSPINTPAVDSTSSLILTEGADRPNTEDAERIIQFGWESGLGVRATARAAGRDPGQVSRKFLRLEQLHGPRPAVANGHTIANGREGL